MASFDRFRHTMEALIVLAFLFFAACGGGGGGGGGSSGGGDGGDQTQTPVNQSPSAFFTASASSGSAPLTVSFDASGSTDPDGAIARYEWSFGDGGSSTGSTTAHTFSSIGSFTVTLRVVDNDGSAGTNTLTVTVLASFSLSGAISAPANVAVDGDVNDTSSPLDSNDTPATAQSIFNPVTLGGYVNAPGAGPEGRSFSSGDAADYFTAAFSQGQQVTLHIADSSAADLDLILLDEGGENVIDASLGTGGSESLTIPSPGAYVIEVFACNISQGCTVNSASNYVLVVGQSTGAGASPARRMSQDFVPGEAVVRFQDPEPLDGAASRSTVSALSASGMSVAAGEPGREQLLTLAAGESLLFQSEIPAVDQGDADMPLNRPTADDLAEKRNTLWRIKTLESRSDVLFAEPNYIRRAFSTPSDPYYPLQWHYPLINLPSAWDVTFGNSGAVVAVVDTGVLSGHPDLSGRITGGYDFIRNVSQALDGDGIDSNPEDPGDEVTGGSSFHGTHVGGTVAAAVNNGVGVAGVAGDARIMPLRVLGKGGAGTLYDILQAVRYAAGISNDSGTTPATRASVINLSLGGPDFSQSGQNVFDLVRANGAIVVAAAGNDSSSEPSYPAAYNNVISVSAVGPHADLAPYSNFGSTVDVAAPGGDMTRDTDGDGYPDGVLSTAGDDTTGTIRNVYAFYQGTSMAAPHVSGVAALMKSVYSGLTPQEFDTLLAAGSLTRDIGATGFDTSFGWGLIDASRAVTAAQSLAGGGSAIAATLAASPASLNFGKTETGLDIQVRNSGSGTLTVTGLSDDASWLSVSSKSTDSDGLGTYTATVSRTGLAEGTYSATITITSSANTVTIGIIMQVAAATEPGDLGFHHVLLVDADTFETVSEAGVSAVNGRYTYSFTNVPAGDYYIFAGTDANNDGFICDPGEACGSYTTLDQPTLVTVNGNRSGLNFSSEFDLSLISIASTDDTGRKPISRRPLKKLR